MRLLLIRHGQTPSNVAGKLDTAPPGPGLTELGHQQAARLVRDGAGQQIDAIFASTLLRTQLTAVPLAVDRMLEPTVLSGIHEIEAGSLEGRNDRDAVRAYLETIYAWGLGDLAVRMPGGADGHAFFDRYDAGIREIAAQVDDSAAVVSHGAAIRVWVAARALNVAPGFAAAHELDNAGVIELTGTPDEGWTLLSWQGVPVGGSAPGAAGAEPEDGSPGEDARQPLGA